MINKGLLFALLPILALASPNMARADGTTDSIAKAKPTEVPQAHLTLREIMDKLQITKEQRHLLQQNRAANRKKLVVIKGKINEKRVDLENEIEKAEPDKDRIKQLTAEIGVLLGQKYDILIEAELDVEKILTPQQVDQLKTLQGHEVLIPTANDIF